MPQPGGSMGRMWHSTRRFRHAFRAVLSSFASVSLGASLLFCVLVPCVGLAQATAAQEGPLQADTDVTQPHALTNETIIKMSQAGLNDGVITQTIRTSAGHYDTSPDGLIKLKAAGVSQRVIAVMQAHRSGLNEREPEIATAPAPASAVTPSPLAPGIDEIGVYYKDKDGSWQPLKTELVQFKSGGWLKSEVTRDIVKEDQNGFVYGQKSTLLLQTGVQILIYTPAGTAPEEYELIRFREKSNGREFRVKTGGVFHSETGSQRDEIEFHPTKLAKQMYTFTMPNDIEKGQYGVLPPGSSNVPGVSNGGKIFTFAIPE